MDWRAESIEKLKEYQARKQALAGLKVEIQRTGMDIAAAQGSQRGDDQLTATALMADLQERLRWAKLWAFSVDGALKLLDKTELQVLDYFYIRPERGGLDGLCSRLDMTKEEAYELKDRALRRFTLALYGVSEG